AGAADRPSPRDRKTCLVSVLFGSTRSGRRRLLLTVGRGQAERLTIKKNPRESFARVQGWVGDRRPRRDHFRSVLALLSAAPRMSPSEAPESVEPYGALA